MLPSQNSDNLMTVHIAKTKGLIDVRLRRKKVVTRPKDSHFREKGNMFDPPSVAPVYGWAEVIRRSTLNWIYSFPSLRFKRPSDANDVISQNPKGCGAKIPFR